MCRIGTQLIGDLDHVHIPLLRKHVSFQCVERLMNKEWPNIQNELAPGLISKDTLLDPV
jgi:hypothetical protein